MHWLLPVLWPSKKMIMEGLDLDQILRDVELEEDDSDNQTPAAGSHLTLVKVDRKLVDEACDKLIADDCLPSWVHAACQTADRNTLVSRMQFLEKCLGERGTCFKSSSKEKAWNKFHLAMNSDNLAPLDNVVNSHFSSWICFAAFELMLSTAFGKCTFKQPANIPVLTANEKDITSYIGGAVLHKLKQKAVRMRDGEERQEILKAVESLAAQGGASSSLTSLLDRDGLVHLHPNTMLLFESLEETFRTMFSGFSISKLSFEAYFQQCCAVDAVSTRFHDHLYSVHIQESQKEKLLKNLIFLYFKVRAHHKCSTFMDDFSHNQHKQKREKSLRKRLKKGNSQQ